MQTDALIVGASGQVGQALARELERRGMTWKGTCHQHPEIDSQLIQINLEDVDSAAALVNQVKPRMVFFPSGWTHVDGCEDDPKKANFVNALAPQQAARAAKALGAAFVYFSTEYVFGEKGGPFDEDSPTGPLGVYGQSKLDGENLVVSVHPSALILRTTVVYGPEPQGKNTVYQVLKRLKAGERVQQPCDQVTTPTYNRDLARAAVELVLAEEEGIFNVVGAQRIDRAAFARLVAEIFGLAGADIEGLQTASMTQKAKRPLDAGLTVTKLAAVLGWTPLSPRGGLEAMRAELISQGLVD